MSETTEAARWGRRIELGEGSGETRGWRGEQMLTGPKMVGLHPKGNSPSGGKSKTWLGKEMTRFSMCIIRSQEQRGPSQEWRPVSWIRQLGEWKQKLECRQ